MTEQGESQLMKDTPEELFKEKNNGNPNMIKQITTERNDWLLINSDSL